MVPSPSQDYKICSQILSGLFSQLYSYRHTPTYMVVMPDGPRILEGHLWPSLTNIKDYYLARSICSSPAILTRIQWRLFYSFLQPQNKPWLKPGNPQLIAETKNRVNQALIYAKMEVIGSDKVRKFEKKWHLWIKHCLLSPLAYAIHIHLYTLLLTSLSTSFPFFFTILTHFFVFAF